MKNIFARNKMIKLGFMLVAVGLIVCFICLAVSSFDIGRFCESGSHVWYRTVSLGDEFNIGIWR